MIYHPCQMDRMSVTGFERGGLGVEFLVKPIEHNIYIIYIFLYIDLYFTIIVYMIYIKSCAKALGYPMCSSLV